MKSVFIVHDNQTFGKGVAQAFQNRAQGLGIKVLGFVPWDAKATSYEAIGEQIATSGAQSVYLGGIVCNNGVKLLKDIGAAVGPKVRLTAPDGFTPYSATLGAGSAAQGMVHQLRRPAARRSWARPARRSWRRSGSTPRSRATCLRTRCTRPRRRRSCSTAIAESNGTRASVVKALFRTNVKNGIMGTFHFDRNGDTVPLQVDQLGPTQGQRGRV